MSLAIDLDAPTRAIRASLQTAVAAVAVELGREPGRRNAGRAGQLVSTAP